MGYLHQEALRQRAKQLVDDLARVGVQGWVVEDAFRDYLAKVAASKDGKLCGNLNLYYSSKRDEFSLKTHELRDKSIIPDVERAWAGITLAPTSSDADASPAQGYQAYVDGSFQNGVTAYGAVILKDGAEIDALSGVVPEGLEGMNQIGGELQAVHVVLEWCQTQDVNKIDIFYDYKGLELWATGMWQTNKSATRAYASRLQQSSVEITWHKVKSHSGNNWNDRADALAQEATRAAAPLVPDDAPAEVPWHERAEQFVAHLGEHGIRAHYAGLFNGQFARVKVQPKGMLDVYNTKKRSPDAPYLQGFADRQLQEQVEALWLAYWRGEEAATQAAHTEATAEQPADPHLRELERLYEIFLPYRACNFDFIILVEALNRVRQHSGQSALEVDDLRFNFEHLETLYTQLRG